MLCERHLLYLNCLLWSQLLVLLIGLLLPAVQKVREAAAVVQSTSQMCQIVLGMQNYAEANEGRLPGCAEPHTGQGLLGMGALLPYVEQESLYRRVFDDPSIDFGTLAPLRIFQNPLDPSRGTGNSKLGWGSPNELGVCGYARKCAGTRGSPHNFVSNGWPVADHLDRGTLRLELRRYYVLLFRWARIELARPARHVRSWRSDCWPTYPGRLLSHHYWCSPAVSCGRWQDISSPPPSCRVRSTSSQCEFRPWSSGCLWRR